MHFTLSRYVDNVNTMLNQKRSSIVICTKTSKILQTSCKHPSKKMMPVDCQTQLFRKESGLHGNSPSMNGRGFIWTPLGLLQCLWKTETWIVTSHHAFFASSRTSLWPARGYLRTGFDSWEQKRQKQIQKLKCIQKVVKETCWVLQFCLPFVFVVCRFWPLGSPTGPVSFP